MAPSKNAGPNFERLKIALAGGRPDCVPLAEVSVDPKLKEDLLGHRVAGLADEVRFAELAGYDHVHLGRRFALGLFPGIGHGEALRWASEHSGVITNWATYEAYPWPDPDKADYREFEQIGQFLTPGMGVIAYFGPVFQWVWMLMGFENFAFALTDDPALIERIFQRVGDIRLAAAENILARCPSVGAAWFPEDIAYSEALMVSPAIWRRYAFPWLKALAGICRRKNIPFIYHSDGVFWDVIEDILSTGVSAIHPIESKGMGADLRALKTRLGSRVCLIGGIDLDTLIRGTPAEVVAETRRVLGALAPVGYVAGSSNTVTGDIPAENYRAMLQTVREYEP
jgi:uroporphyrinogen decarboxylase